MTEKHRELCGVILAAGRGDRLRPLSFHQPKPLLPICNKPILQYQIEAMRSVGIRDIFIVVGYLSSHIINHFGNGSEFGVSLQYVTQDKPLGIAHAVAQLEDYIDRPFLTFLGDIFFVFTDLKRMVAEFHKSGAGAVIAVTREQNPEFIRRNFTVELHRNGTIRRVIEKPRFVTNNLKGCGIYLFDLPIFDAIRLTPRTAMRDEYEITNSIQILIDNGYAAYPAEVVRWDMNVTIPCDLLDCNLHQLHNIGCDCLVGDDAELHDDCTIVNSVIGRRVHIDHPIYVRDSLILDDVVVTSRDNIERKLITTDSIIPCRESAFIKGDQV